MVVHHVSVSKAHKQSPKNKESALRMRCESPWSRIPQFPDGTYTGRTLMQSPLKLTFLLRLPGSRMPESKTDLLSGSEQCPEGRCKHLASVSLLRPKLEDLVPL